MKLERVAQFGHDLIVAVCFLGGMGMLVAAGHAVGHDTDSIRADAFYEQAQDAVARGQLAEAVALLRTSFELGFDAPMGVVIDPRLSALVGDPGIRPQIRDLLREYARDGMVAMTQEDEPGEILWVEGTLVDETDGSPIEGALVELVHADARGRYSNDETWNPRLFGFMRSSRDGTFRARTIRPGAYEDDEGNAVTAHIHFSILAEGYRPFHSEFLLVDVRPPPESPNRETLVATVRSMDRGKVCSISIPLQPLPSE